MNKNNKYFQIKNLKSCNLDYLVLKQDYLLKISEKCIKIPFLYAFFFEKFIKVSDEILDRIDAISTKHQGL